ncbi:MAG: hypothetical protein JJU11_05485, partial [Candidatus Sumerlaeia bacterium]|nr:hypothetical protein [Candidatus Sumerlaeia bacterium]
MPSSPTDFFDELNARVDPEAVLGLVLREGEEITRMGRSIKAHCPVHGSGNFKSLHVDLNLGTCRCVVRECRASHAMSLLEFYALCEDLPLPAAVISLCRELDHPIPETFLENLRGRTWADFETARRERRHDDAIKALPILGMFDDFRTRVPSWRAELELEKSGGRDSRGIWLVAVEEFSQLGELGEAVGILERLHEESPEDIEILALLGDAQRKRHPKSSTWGGTYFQRAQLLIGEGRSEEALAIIGDAMEVLSKSAELRETHGQLLLSMGREDEAKPELWTAAFLYEQQGLEEQAIPLLEKVIALDPEDTQSREKVAEFRIRLGDLGSYLRYMEDLAKNAMERNEWANAELYARKILGRTRENAVAKEILAAVHERKDQPVQAARCVLVAARARHRLGEMETANVHLNKARETGLEGTDAQAELAETLIVFGERTEAIGILQRTAVSLLELDLATEATPLLMRIADLAPDPSEFATSTAEISESMEVSDILSLWERAAFSHLDDGNVEQAVSLARLGGETLSHTPAAGLLQLRVLKAAGQDSEAIEALEKAVADAMARENPEAVLELLREGCEAFPESPALLEKLAKMAFSNGAREESLAVWRQLIRIPGLAKSDRIAHAAQAVALPGGGPPFKLLEGLAHWQNGNLPDAAGVYTDLCGDLLQPGSKKGNRPFKVDSTVLDEYLGFLGVLKGHTKKDLFVRLANMMELALSDSWSRLERLCISLAELSSPAESLSIAGRFVESSLADDRHEEAHQAIVYILEHLAPGDLQWRETHALTLAHLDRREESRTEWLSLAEVKPAGEGLATLRKALEHLPGDRLLQRELLKHLLDDGEIDEALELADELIAHHRMNDELAIGIEIGRKVLEVDPGRLAL